MPSGSYNTDVKQLVNELERLKQLKLKLSTEQGMLEQEKKKLIEVLGLEQVPSDLDGYILMLEEELTKEVEELKITPEIQSELANIEKYL